LPTYTAFVDEKGIIKPVSRGELAAYVARDKPDQEYSFGVIRRPKHDVNHIQARRRIIRDHGWPGEDFRETECVTALLAFEAKAKELFDAMKDAVPYENRYDPAYLSAYVEPEKVYDSFLVDSAGDLAVCQTGPDMFG